LYALGVGAGQPDPADELAFTTENTAGVSQRVLPTYAIVIAQTAPGLRIDYGDYPRRNLVHTEQQLTMHRPLPAEGSARLRKTVTGVYDKSSGALIATKNVAVDPASGEPLFETRQSVLIRGLGGFGGDRGPASEWRAPTRTPDLRLSLATRPDQALLYRLSGDRNPLHSDPAFAERAGFSRPILHGLCTYGITARGLLRELANSDPAQFRSISGRFTKPVIPGDELTVSLWYETPSSYVFITTNSAGEVVIDQGSFTTSEESESP
jgi:acyl dehydratase